MYAYRPDIKRDFLKRIITHTGIFLIPIGLYALFVSVFVSPVPFWDDFNIHLAFLNHWQELALPDRLGLLFERNGEHYVLTNKLATLFDFLVFGSIDFRRLILTGNLLYLAGALIWVFICSRNTTARLIMLSLMLTPVFPQSMLWGSGSLQHLPVFLWAGIFVARAPGHLWSAAAAIIMASFSQGNGILAAICFGIVTTFDALCRHGGSGFPNVLKDAMQGLFWFTGGLLFLLLVVMPDESTASGILSMGWQRLRYVAVFLGSPLSQSPQQAVWIGFVLAVMGMCAVLMVRGEAQPARTGILWIMATAAANSVFRDNLGADYAFWQSRYAAPGLYFIACLWAVLHVKQMSHRRRNIALLLGCLICALVWVQKLQGSVSEARSLKTALSNSAVRFALSGSGLSYPIEGQKQAISILQKAIQRGLFSWPQEDLKWHMVRPQSAQNLVESRRVVSRLEWLLCTEDYLYVEGWAFHSREPGVPVVAMQAASGELYKLSTVPDARIDVVRHHSKADALLSGISVLAPRHDLPAGLRAVGLGIVTAGGLLKVRRLAENFDLTTCRADSAGSRRHPPSAHSLPGSAAY